jgi:hypothetical protein
MRQPILMLVLLWMVSSPTQAAMNDVTSHGHYNDRHDQRICRRLTPRPGAYDLCKLPPLAMIPTAG